MSFYQDEPDNELRFGDVVRGFPVSAAHIDRPAVGEALREYRIDVGQPEFGVIMMPCCSIKSESLLLTPLLQINRNFYKNPYWADDLLRLNRPMTPKHAVSPNEWERMTLEEREQRFDLSKPTSFAVVDCFIYAPHDLLPPYVVTQRKGHPEIGYYMVDFRLTCRVQCKAVTRQQSPVEAKVLQLTIDARGDLRDKIADFFGRVPSEDEV
ncbi:MAG: hypothetical protein ACYSVY_06440 [Planctomycetota bacterium]|jgi:hypothetical protein